MIKIFRKIRQNLVMENKTSKYFKYAIGEIILVVIGILIALQINNWNEGRKENQKEKATLQRFLNDLKADSINFQTNLNYIKAIDSLHVKMFTYSQNPDSTITFQFPTYIRRALVYIPTARENDPEITDKINQHFIREEIQNYFRSMNMVSDGKTEFEDIVYKIRAFIRNKKLHNTKAWFESKRDLKLTEINNQIITKEDLLLLAKDPDFQQLLFESNIKLIEAKNSFENLITSNENLIQLIVTHLKN
ncbi:MAG: hypothetical protein CO117_06955 [Flavobacteriaceae bacterium CG_4_9_14_3_um_filter_33_16]|nr:MAG: hypothetical protein CO117_06955 [Flavobacteriaceae bacterium CG_4_9_14_3_um_filter_33_16]